jgi:hypothetical protein
LHRYDFVRPRRELLVRGTPKRVVDFTPGEIEAAPARQVMRTRVVEVGDA